MKRMLESITGGYTASGRVAGNALILTLPDAVTPVVWRFDLSQVRSSALEVREQDNEFLLVIKTPRGESHDVARFADRAGAIRALMAASRALEEQDEAVTGDATATTETSPAARREELRRDEARDDYGRFSRGPRRGNGGKWVAGILAVLLLLVILIAMRAQAPTAGNFDAATGTPVPGASADAANAAGVPVSADQFLMQNTAKASQ